MAGFVKRFSISGREKAAVLFSELGPYVTEDMLKYFSTSELAKLRKTIKRLGSSYDVDIENAVLEETARFGMMRGYLPEDTLRRINQDVQIPVEKPNPVLSNPNVTSESLAKVLSMWLKEE